MLHRFGPLALFIVLGLAGLPRPALACSCIKSGPPCQAYWKTDAVFDATVVSISPLDAAASPPAGDVRFADKIVKVDVRQSWKGVEPGPLEIMTGPEGGGCGFPFKAGGRYLVFAFRGPTDGRWRASICSLTQEFNGNGPAADFLTSLSAPGTGGRVFGTVRTMFRTFDHERPRSESQTETLVRLAGGGQERSTRSSNGRYEFSGLAEGPYRVDVLLPDGYATYSASRDVQIPNRRACAEENFSFSPAGRLIGRLVGPDGRGLPRVRVEVTSPDAQPHSVYGLPLDAATTDSNGYFDMQNLSPGRYIAGVNLKDLPNQYNPYARTLYPGDTPEPEVLTLSLGQTIDLGTWRLPAPLEVVRVAGIVTWSDGTPAAGVYVSVLDRTENPVERARGAGGATSDADGRFVVDLRRRRVYTFAARDRQSKPLPLSAPRLEIGAGVPQVVRIVILGERREP